MYIKQKEMSERNRVISQLRFDKELKKIAEETNQDYFILREQNEIDTNSTVLNLTRELNNEILRLDVDV